MRVIRARLGKGIGVIRARPAEGNGVIGAHSVESIGLTGAHPGEGIGVIGAHPVEGIGVIGVEFSIVSFFQLYNWRSGEFQEMEDLLLPDVARSMVWSGHNLCVGFKREYSLIKVS